MSKGVTKEFSDSFFFDNLPISFACVVTDMVTNKKEVIRSGNLVDAIRASMGIPLIFAPVRKNGKVLIDGGFKDNLAIEVTLHASDRDSDFYGKPLNYQSGSAKVVRLNKSKNNITIKFDQLKMNRGDTNYIFHGTVILDFTDDL